MKENITKNNVACHNYLFKFSIYSNLFIRFFWVNKIISRSVFRKILSVIS
jgi:hypothetical protein